MSQHPPLQIPDYFPGELPAFSPGQIIRHKHYGYLGVVVDFDMACQADQAWYENNKAQPDRGQPWYHVLVHGSNGNTYAAQENLAPAQLDEPVNHPLVDVFFEPVDQGQYERNHEPWPSWNGP